MRRANHLFERIADRDNLRLAVHKALTGKRSKGDARAFISQLDDNLEWMRSALLRGGFPLGFYNQFTIFDPKERLITAPCFRERVLHHAIMNVCEPIFERRLIADTFACRRNKGRLAALQRAQHFSRRFAFFLKMDIRKYFDSISHPILLARLGGIQKHLSNASLARIKCQPDRMTIRVETEGNRIFSHGSNTDRTRIRSETTQG